MEIEIEKLLINRTKYQGNAEPNRKAISASEFGSEMLQIWLRQKYGVIENKEFTQSTLGSIMHLGVQELLKDEYDCEVECEICMNDEDWMLTGSIDLLNDKEIIDIKVTKSYTMQKVLEDPNHQYVWQLSVYRYLMWVIEGKVLDTKLLFLFKDGGVDFRNMTTIPSFKLVEIEPKSFKEVEGKFNEIVNELKRYDELNLKPPQCKDLWFRKTKDGSIPMKCEYYCGYKNVCPYYKVNPNKINF